MNILIKQKKEKKPAYRFWPSISKAIHMWFRMRGNQAYKQCYDDHQDQISDLAASTPTILMVTHKIYQEAWSI
jgi:hypothetical protein